MQDAKTLRERIYALEWYYASNYSAPLPSVNVKVRGRYKDVHDVAATLPASPFKEKAVEIVKDMEKVEFSFFWDACKIEGDYIMECLFDGVAWNKDEPEWVHINMLSPYKNKTGFFGRSGGHFCIGITRGELDDMLDASENADDGRYTLDDVEKLLDAIEWGLKLAKDQSENVPATIESEIEYMLEEKIDKLEAEAKERATPRYKIDRLREWERTLTNKERDAIARSVKSIEKLLSTLAGD